MLRIVALRLSYIRPLRGRKKRQRRDKQQHRASEAPPYVRSQIIIKPCKGASRSRGNAGFRPYRAQCFFLRIRRALPYATAYRAVGAQLFLPTAKMKYVQASKTRPF